LGGGWRALRGAELRRRDRFRSWHGEADKSGGGRLLCSTVVMGGRKWVETLRNTNDAYKLTRPELMLDCRKSIEGNHGLDLIQEFTERRLLNCYFLLLL
jgi:hypothetical protein